MSVSRASRASRPRALPPSLRPRAGFVCSSYHVPFYLVSVLVDVWILQVTNKFRRLLMALPERDLESLAQGYRPQRTTMVYW